MKYKIKDYTGFMGSVFGADCLVKYYPELLTAGVILLKVEDRYYVINGKTHKVDNDTCFFSEDEMRFLEGVVEVKMTRTVGILKKDVVYPLLPEYSNELNVCIDVSDQEGEPKVLFMDKREKHRNFEYL